MPRALTVTLPQYTERLAFSPDGALIAAPGNFGQVFLYDTETGDERVTLSTGDSQLSLSQLEFSPAGDLLAATAQRGGPPPSAQSVPIWSVPHGDRVKRLTGVWYGYLSYPRLAFSPDGKRLVVPYGDKGTSVRFLQIAGFEDWTYECTSTADCDATETCNFYLHRCVASPCRDGVDNDGDGVTDDDDGDCAAGEIEVRVEGGTP